MLGAARIDARWRDDKWELSELVSVDWACTGLEVFGCRSEEYHDRTSLVDSEALPRLSWSRPRQNWRALRPCYKVREVRRHLDHNFYDCLAMSLESGLDLLANLGDLRRVDLEDMSVEIGNPAEQAWVAEHWPLATVVYARYPETGSGTNVNSYIDGEPDDRESDEYPDGYLYRRRLEDFDDELGNGIVDYS
ncbi:hypothetical protein BGZ88_009489 [Linnemannia elongata]|nr:hypothetical protein BGZ88_009489 [Linnemannia elongata]